MELGLFLGTVTVNIVLLGSSTGVATQRSNPLSDQQCVSPVGGAAEILPFMGVIRLRGIAS